MTFPTYDEWFATLTLDQQKRTKQLVSALRALGAEDAEGWARSEISEDIPQFARFLVLRSIWPELIDSWVRQPAAWVTACTHAAARDPDGHFADAGAALARVTSAGVSVDDIGTIARMVAYETAFGLLNLVDEGYASDAPVDAPGWRLMETDADGQLTGRSAVGLHESILSMDPSGREGRPPTNTAK